MCQFKDEEKEEYSQCCFKRNLGKSLVLCIREESCEQMANFVTEFEREGESEKKRD